MPHGPLPPKDCVVALIDHQPPTLFEVANYDPDGRINNSVGLARAAELFGVPVVVSTVETPEFSGYMLLRLRAVFPDAVFHERASMNAWEDAPFRAAIAATGRRKLLLAGLWTKVCVTFPAIQALAEGYEVHVVEDACGGIGDAARSAAMDWMVKAGAVPLRWRDTVLEWQRDRAWVPTGGSIADDIGMEHVGIMPGGLAPAALAAAP